MNHLALSIVVAVCAGACFVVGRPVGADAQGFGTRVVLCVLGLLGTAIFFGIVLALALKAGFVHEAPYIYAYLVLGGFIVWLSFCVGVYTARRRAS
jgi:hypothetical protein